MSICGVNKPSVPALDDLIDDMNDQTLNVNNPINLNDNTNNQKMILNDHVDLNDQTLDVNDNQYDQTMDDKDNRDLNPLALLPAEVWLKIFQDVEPEDLLRLARVSHHFAELAREPRLWRKMKIKASHLGVNNVKRICAYRWLEEVQLEGRDETGACIPEQFFINLATFSPRLKTLKIHDCVLEQSYINHLAKGCPGLKVLEIRFCKLVGFSLQLSWFKELKVFNMLDCDFVKRSV